MPETGCLCTCSTTWPLNMHPHTEDIWGRNDFFALRWRCLQSGQLLCAAQRIQTERFVCLIRCEEDKHDMRLRQVARLNPFLYKS